MVLLNAEQVMIAQSARAFKPALKAVCHRQRTGARRCHAPLLRVHRAEVRCTKKLAKFCALDVRRGRNRQARYSPAPAFPAEMRRYIENDLLMYLAADSKLFVYGSCGECN